jgi:hypothetical protein
MGYGGGTQLEISGGRRSSGNVEDTAELASNSNISVCFEWPQPVIRKGKWISIRGERINSLLVVLSLLA